MYCSFCVCVWVLLSLSLAKRHYFQCSEECICVSLVSKEFLINLKCARAKKKEIINNIQSHRPTHTHTNISTNIYINVIVVVVSQLFVCVGHREKKTQLIAVLKGVSYGIVHNSDVFVLVSVCVRVSLFVGVHSKEQTEETATIQNIANSDPLNPNRRLIFQNPQKYATIFAVFLLTLAILVQPRWRLRLNTGFGTGTWITTIPHSIEYDNSDGVMARQGC